MPSRKNDDGSTSLSHSDSLHLAEFDIQQFDKEQKLGSDGNTIFQEITGDDIKEIVRQKKYTWIILWATWCPHSYIDLPTALQYYSDHLKNKDLNVILIAQNYDIESSKKTLSETSYDKQSYILSSAKYKNDEFEKVIKLKKEICKECPLTKITPQHILLDENARLVFYNDGELRNPDTLLSLIK